jgi:[ribosomal protein S18]-alanine N-acetyltransferase
MTDNIIYRNANKLDLNKISEIDKAVFKSSSYPRFFIRQAFDVFGSLLGVAHKVSGDDLVGYTLGAISSDNSKEGWILSLAVKHEYQNKGIGYKLTERLVSRLRELGVDRVFLTVRPDNVLAISLYKKFGFTKDQLDNEYFGPGESRLLMTYKKDS